MRYFGTALLTGAFLLLTGCVTTGPYDFTAYHEEKPRSILILPVVNDSLDVQAPTSVLTTLPRLLGELGYYVYPVNTVKTILEYEGLYEPAEVQAMPTSDLAGLFGADAFLYITVHSWTSKYVLISTTTEVDFEYEIRNSVGESLWTARKKLTYTPQSNSSGSPMAQLLSAAITAAVEKANPHYLPLTRQANGQVFYRDATAIPPGPYWPGYEAYYLGLEQGVSEKGVVQEDSSELEI